ncbi:MAG: hypothetical protein FD133_309 [Erysipelotrichaceae bacterium]|nr:MAG: hypothetical protein FD179_1221 [Erysipelotrichaceae bacterium]TXT19491.1 MAG: hypothetical protein FD133_309 [Erysipelotrichaceae bacterium]
MIRGLDLFKRRFEEYKDQYVLIGGSASWVVMDKAGLPFRPTKDLDIVLIIETLSYEFTKAFYQFIRDGKYKISQKSNGKSCFYRFTKPENQDYPFMIEILSKGNGSSDDLLPGSITRMSIEEEIISLSAIVLNDDLYTFLRNNTTIVEGLSVADEICLIPLKIRAWIDLTEKKISGIKIKEGDIQKHKNDVYLLSQLLTANPLKEVPNLIQKDVVFFSENCPDKDDKLKELGLENTSIHEIMVRLKLIYLVS